MRNDARQQKDGERDLRDDRRFGEQQTNGPDLVAEEEEEQLGRENISNHSLGVFEIIEMTNGFKSERRHASNRFHFLRAGESFHRLHHSTRFRCSAVAKCACATERSNDPLITHHGTLNHVIQLGGKQLAHPPLDDEGLIRGDESQLAEKKRSLGVHTERRV